jgi:hypothetical protein
MTLSPSQEERVIAEAARLIVAELRGRIDFEDLVTLPIGFVAQTIGKSVKQTARILPVRPMGARNQGVSLKALKAYQNHL